MGNMGFPYLMSMGCVWQVIFAEFVFPVLWFKHSLTMQYNML